MQKAVIRDSLEVIPIMFDDGIIIVEDDDYSRLDLSEFPLVKDFGIKLEDHKTFGMQLTFVDSKYSLTSFPWWDYADTYIRNYTEKSIPYGDIKEPYFDLEQGWKICIFKEGGFVYIMQGGDPGKDEYYSWYKVDFERYKEAWLKTIERCKNECVSFKTIEDAVNNNRDERVEQLVLNYNGLDSFPKEIFRFINLKKLKFMGDKIGDIPEEIGRLKKLEILAFSGSGIKKLPKNLSKLSNLKELYLNNNELKEIPNCILKLKNLETLDICGSKFPIEIPKEINRLESLKSLWLNDSSIRTIPDEIGDLANLELLSISNNKFKCLPETFCNLSRLKTLYCLNTNLKVLPENLHKLKSIRVFQVSNEFLKKSEKQRGKGILKKAFID